MSTGNTEMVHLLKRQEQDRQDLAAGAFEAWQSVKENEKQILASYDGQHEHAPQEIKDAIQNGREAYFEEWGSEGRLAAVMSERHEKERGKFAESSAKRQEIFERLKQNQQRSNEKDRER